MIIVDTSVWISYLRKDNEDNYNVLKSYLNRRHVLAISAVFGELLQGVKNKREFELVTLLWQNLPKLNESELFIAAGELSNTHQLYAKGVGLIDCYILSAAYENRVGLWTLDKKLAQAATQILQ
ncbi:MAG: PIN domain-containing protein [Cyclobacteriaceae bacterium]